MHLGLLDVVQYDVPSMDACYPDLDPVHDAHTLNEMLSTAVQVHNDLARTAYNHLIEWIQFDTKPGLSKIIDRTFAVLLPHVMALVCGPTSSI